MSTSATVTYSAVPIGGVFNYEVLLHNTSPAPFDIYSFMFGWQYNVPITGTFPLQNIVLISAPPGWTGFLSAADITWGTSDQGSSIASGYIMPGQSGTFVFQSTTAPPATLPFGCCFYNNCNEWGFCFNGTAHHDLGLRKPPYYAVINPLVLILGDELFARLNLPRPLPLTRSLRGQIAPGIQSMIPAQRETAARALDAYIAALTEVRAALKEPQGARSNP
jgi:hypothetical protein